MPSLRVRDLVLVASLTACSSSSGSSPIEPTPDAGSSVDAAKTKDAATKDAATKDAAPKETGSSDSGATTTIAAARKANVTTPITVQAVVTALHGTPPSDLSQWYIEDPAGGPESGVAVYCDPDLSSCPADLRAPTTANALVEITGTLSTYKSTLQFIPTAQKILMATTTPPPVATVTAADLASSADSPYRGVVVKLTTKVTVDDVTPMALYDTQCATGTTTDAGTTDAGPTLCSGCTPPTYSGFRAHDASGNELYVEDFFFSYDHYQSSPECLTASGETPVTVGETFSSFVGVLDYDGYAGVQALYPLSDKDIVTP